MTLTVSRGAVVASGSYSYDVSTSCSGSLCTNVGQCANGAGCPPVVSQTENSDKSTGVSGGVVTLDVEPGAYVLAAGLPTIPIHWTMQGCCDAAATSGDMPNQEGIGTLSQAPGLLQMGTTLPTTLSGMESFTAPQLDSMGTVTWDLTSD